MVAGRYALSWGIDLVCEASPDATALELLRLLEKHELTCKIVETINAHPPNVA